MRSRLVFRLVVPSLAVSVFLLALGALAGWYVHVQQNRASRLMAESANRVRTAGRTVSAIREVRFYLNRFAISGDRRHLDAIRSVIVAMRNELAQAELLDQTESKKDLLQGIREAYSELDKELDTLFAESQVDPQRTAQSLAEGLVTERLLVPAQEYVDLGESAIVLGGQRMQAVADRVGFGLLLLGACGAVAGLVAGFAIARGVQASLLQVYLPIKLATGKLEEVIGPIKLERRGDVEELDAVLQALTERVDTVVDRLRQSQLEVLRAEQLAAVGQLGAGLAHELRNPLMAMKILIQTATEAKDSGCLQGRDLSVLQEEVTRLEKAIQRFLDFAKPPRLERHRFDLRSVVQQTLDLVSHRAGRQDVRIQSHLPEAPLEVYADPEQVRQVLLNTLMNSLDALPEGGNIWLELSTEEACQEGRQDGKHLEALEGASCCVAIRVADDGVGIPKELGERIFDPFISTKDTGLGLGLATCRRIVEAHGGEIRAGDSSAGTGAEFHIRLPSRVRRED